MRRGDTSGSSRATPTTLTATDIPVFDELPLDLSVVAGVITRAVQDTNSHVNLKSKERGTPNMVLRDAGPEHPRLAPFADQPVHLVVAQDDFMHRADDRRRSSRPSWPSGWTARSIRLQWSPRPSCAPSTRSPPARPRQARAFAARYGSKAANLGFLAHRQVLGPRRRHAAAPARSAATTSCRAGSRVPLQAYRDFIEHPPNADVRALIDAFVDAEKAGELSPQERAARSTRSRPAIMAASFPPGALERVRAKIDEVIPGVEKIKVRSSANAEDVPELRRRRPARQLRRRHDQARPPDRAVPRRGGRRATTAR